MWFSGPWPLPIGNAVAMPWCVYIVANETASTTDGAMCSRMRIKVSAGGEETGERKAYVVVCELERTPVPRRAYIRSHAYSSNPNRASQTA